MKKEEKREEEAHKEETGDSPGFPLLTTNALMVAAVP